MSQSSGRPKRPRLVSEDQSSGMKTPKKELQRSRYLTRGRRVIFERKFLQFYDPLIADFLLLRLTVCRPSQQQHDAKVAAG